MQNTDRKLNALRLDGNSPSVKHFTPVFLLFYTKLFKLIAHNNYITKRGNVNSAEKIYCQ